MKRKEAHSLIDHFQFQKSKCLLPFANHIQLYTNSSVLSNSQNIYKSKAHMSLEQFILIKKLLAAIFLYKNMPRQKVVTRDTS